MQTTLWLMIGIAILIVLLGIAAVILNKNKKHKPDYYAFYIMGIIWLPLGIVMKNHGLFALGLIFLIVGIVNKKKWKKNRRNWKNMDSKEKKLMIIISLILGILVLVGLIVLYLAKKGLF